MTEVSASQTIKMRRAGVGCAAVGEVRALRMRRALCGDAPYARSAALVQGRLSAARLEQFRIWRAADSRPYRRFVGGAFMIFNPCAERTHPLFTIHYSLFTVHCSPFTIRYFRPGGQSRPPLRTTLGVLRITVRPYGCGALFGRLIAAPTKKHERTALIFGSVRPGGVGRGRGIFGSSGGCAAAT